MKNLLLILHETNISRNAVETAITISKKNRDRIQVFFTGTELQSCNKNDIAVKNKDLVESMCLDAGIDFIEIHEKEISLAQILSKDTSIDLVIAGSTRVINSLSLSDHLANAKCPVYLISADSNKIENIVFSYDGSFSSINAINEYSRLFPEMLHLPTHFVQVSSDDNDEYARQKNIQSWLPKPYSNVQYKILNDSIGTEFLKFIKSIPDCITVIGSRCNKQAKHFSYF